MSPKRKTVFVISRFLPEDNYCEHFSNVWIAGTRGTKYLVKKVILDCNITELCDLLIKMLKEKNEEIRCRHPLSFLARLIIGVVKIYNKKVEMCCTEFITFWIHVSSNPIKKPADLLTGRLIEITVIESVIMYTLEKKKLKRKMKTNLRIESPVMELENDCIVTDTAQITLPDDVPNSISQNEDFFGDLGVISDEELISILKPAVLDVPLLPPNDPVVISECNEESRLPKRKASESIVSSPIKKSRKLNIKVQQPNNNVVETSENFDNSKQFIIRKRTGKSICVTKHQLFVKIRRRKNYNIIRKPITRAFIDKIVYLTTPKQFTFKNVFPLMKNLVQEEHFSVFCGETPRCQQQRFKSATDLPSLLQINDTENTVLNISKNDVTLMEVQNQNNTSFCVGEFEVLKESQELPLSPISDSPIISKRWRPAKPLTSSQEHNFTYSVNTPSKSIPTDTERQIRIRKIMENWEELSDLFIENLCPVPINRFNIAITFADLLCLHKIQVIELHSKPGSLELGKIKRGMHF